MEDFIAIGKTQKPHGLKGELKLHVEEMFIEDLFEAEAVFIEIKGNKMPYFIEELQEGNSIILKLEDVNDRTAAEFVAHKEVFMRRSDISLTDREILSGGMVYKFTEGFLLVEVDAGRIGIVEEVISLPQQEMALVRYKNKLIYIPMQALFIMEIDESEKKILMDLPLGILD